MKQKHLLQSIICLPLLVLFLQCKQKTNPKNENVSTKEIQIFNLDKLGKVGLDKMYQLDETHPNMLEPRNSKDENDKVAVSWSTLHQNIGNFLAKNNFSWEVEDPSISIMQKIYFDPNGNFKQYFFKIKNPSVTEEKKDEFANLMVEFAKTNKVDYSMDKAIARCGPTRYKNE